MGGPLPRRHPEVGGDSLIFTPTAVAGAFLVDLERREDERGFFARLWDREELEGRGLEPGLAQSSLSFNRRRGTLRGMHYQAAPHEEVKLVRCTRGAVWDVVLDLRRDSASFRRHFGVALSEDNRRSVYVPRGCAHGFLTLTDGAEVVYLISEFHRPPAARGVRWDDPTFAIEWPEEPQVISPRDRSWPEFTG